jgi:WD40 repeat protein
MRIFLSYGHDEHTPLAQRLKSDLERRNHQVWFDQARLTPGADWERYIEEGLDWLSAAPGKFLMLLTPHSVRRPNGYCLNELARACARQLPIIPLMVSTVEPPLSICRIQHLDFRDCVPAEQHEPRYAAQFDKLLDAIDHDRLDFEGVQARLQRFLPPIEYDEASRHLPRFTGREWVMQEVEAWLASPRRVLWITGEAGIGKSALAAWLCDRRPEIAAAHYCRYGNANRSDRKALLSLAWQLTTQLPDYKDRLNASPLEAIAAETNLRGLFDRLFVEPFTHSFPKPERSVVLLIDALDEGDLASLIGTEWSRTPDWLRLIVTSRPHESEINAALQSLDPWPLDAGREENQEDIRTYLRRELRQPKETIIEAILEKSEGLFLYVRWVREELQAGRLSLANIDAFPRGLGGIYNQFFKRYFPDIRDYAARWRPVIETICAARQPLPPADLHALFPAFYDPSEITSGLGSLFPDSGGGVRPFHQSVRDWVTNADRAGAYVVRVDLGHQRLADQGWRTSSYYVLHLPAHLSACGRKSDLAKLLLDPEWIAAKLKRADVSALLADYEYLKEDEACALVRDAIQLSTHVIATHSDELASQLVGRLLAYNDVPLIREFSQNAGRIATGPWLRPLHAVLSPPGTPLLYTLEAASVRGVAVTPDGTRAVSAGDQTLEVWDLATGRALRTLRGHYDLVHGVAVTPDGKRAVSASWDKTLRVWDLATGGALRTLQGHSDRVNSVAVTPDGKRAVSASWDHTLKVWDLETGGALRTLQGHSESVWGVAVTPDGKRVVSASWDHTLKVWDLATGRALRTLGGHSASVYGVAVSPDGKRAVSASADCTLKVWDLETGRVLRTLEGHSNVVYGVAVSLDGKRAVSASWDKTLKVWDLETGRELGTLKGHSGPVWAVAVTLDGKWAVSVSSDQTLKVWDLATRRAPRTPESHSDSVNGMAVTPDGKRAVSASRDRTLKVWDLATGRTHRTLEGHSPVSAVAITPDGKGAVSASRDQTLKVWDLETARPLRTLEGHSPVWAVAVTPDGEQAVSASDDHMLRVWDLDTGRVRRTLKGHSGPVWGVAVTADGKRAVSASDDHTLKLWDLDTGRALCTLEDHSASVSGLAVTPDGKRAVSASADETLNVWDLATGRALRTLEGHSAGVHGVAVTPDGRRVASASQDQTLKVWDLDTGLLIATFHCDAPANCCAFADNHRIVAGDQGGRVYILSLEENFPPPSH